VNGRARNAESALRAGDPAGLSAVVLGLGRFGGGSAAARWLALRGARVVGTDLRTASELPEACAALADLEVELVLGGHDGVDLENADLVVVNPAVPPTAPPVERARKGGALVTSEIELFLASAPCRLVGVTGTQGKSSTVSFTAQLLEAAGQRTFVGGNLGGSLLDRMDTLSANDVAVLELSSYQLEGLNRPPIVRRPFEAVAVTNVLADHLERHGDLASYTAAKARILELLAPDGLAVLPDGPGPASAWTAARAERFDAGPGDAAWSARTGLPPFQAPNLRAALALAGAVLGDPARLAAARASATFAPPPHRCERLADLAGATVIDNGVSTTPDSTAAALEGLAGPVVLVVGGLLKDLDLAPLLRAAAPSVRAAVCFGSSSRTLAAALAGAGVPADAIEDLDAAVEKAVERAVAGLRAGEVLLFSPAAASFDTHANFRERALAFRRALERARAASEEGRGAVSS